MADLKEKTAFSSGWNFDNSYTKLPLSLFVKQNPTKVKAPHIVLFNKQLAISLGLNAKKLFEDDGNII
ncbi:MAG: hypothetical protein Q8L73_09400, partial [Methylotenera sp.]|nr:hypothetical protein [Methylotenera sp.]